MRWPAAVVGTAALFRHHRAPALVTPVGEFYAHRYRSGIFVFPGLAGETADFYRQQAIDSFFWGYCPTVGDSVIDVGAGIGEETLTASRLVGKNGRIMAIEAHPTTFKRLELMCQLNHLDNVIPIQCAVTAQTGTAHIQNDVNYVGAALIPEGGVEVPAASLDDLCASVPGDIDLVKINIEGAEREAIRGMDRTIARTRNVVISCHDFLGAGTATFEEVSGFIRGQGFQIATRPDDPLPWNRFMVYGHR